MDDFQPQSSVNISMGHEEGDFSLRGIILFIVILVASAIVTFIAAAGLMRLFEWWEVTHSEPSTAVQQQLSQQRGEMATKEGLKPQPEWYNRSVDEKVLEKTFATPRLQYDDASDMGSFLQSETDWLEGTGKSTDGTIHIPIQKAIDELSQKGLPPVNGTFVSQPRLGGLMAVSEAAQNRLKTAGAQVQQPAPQQSNKKK